MYSFFWGWKFVFFLGFFMIAYWKKYEIHVHITQSPNVYISGVHKPKSEILHYEVYIHLTLIDIDSQFFKMIQFRNISVYIPLLV